MFQNINENTIDGHNYKEEKKEKKKIETIHKRICNKKHTNIHNNTNVINGRTNRRNLTIQYKYIRSMYIKLSSIIRDSSMCNNRKPNKIWNKWSIIIYTNNTSANSNNDF